MIKQPALYLDMDDVVADWMTEANRFLKDIAVQEQIHDSYKISTSSWNRLSEHTRFYRNLPTLPGADQLIAWARDYSKRKGMYLAFLTAIPHDDSTPHAANDKVLWAAERWPDIPVFIGPYSYDKQHHAKPGDILIDDRHENCKEWASRGGIAHIYTNWNECKEWIRNTLGDKI